MAHTVSLGIMEQKELRQATVNAQEESEIREVLNRVTHVEGKYLETLEVMRNRVFALGGPKPLLLHAQYPATGSEVLNMVNPSFNEQLGAGFAGKLKMFQPEWVSFHLGFSCERVISGGQFDFSRAGSAVLPESVVRERIVRSLAFLRNEYLPATEIMMENLDYNPRDRSGAYEYVCDPEFVTAILKETGCGLLLDFGHANCSAQNMGYDDVMDYISRLPLEKVKEIHMSGAGHRDGLAHDSHLLIHKPGQPEVRYLEEALKSGRMTNLDAVTLETFEEILPQLDLLQSVLERNGCAVAFCRAG